MRRKKAFLAGAIICSVALIVEAVHGGNWETLRIGFGTLGADLAFFELAHWPFP